MPRCPGCSVVITLLLPPLLKRRLCLLRVDLNRLGLLTFDLNRRLSLLRLLCCSMGVSFGFSSAFFSSEVVAGLGSVGVGSSFFSSCLAAFCCSFLRAWSNGIS